MRRSLLRFLGVLAASTVQVRPKIEGLLANGSTQKFIAKRDNTIPAKPSN